MRLSGLWVVAFVLASCGGGLGGSTGIPGVGGGVGGGGGHPLGSDAGASGTGGGGSFGAGGSAGTGGGVVSGSGPGTGTGTQAGVLTAGAWDDNLNFDFYLTYLGQRAQLPGALVMPRGDRLVVLAKDKDGKPLPGARVTLSKGTTAIASTITGADGRALFFPEALGLVKNEAIALSASAGVISGPVGGTTAVVGDAQATISAATFAAQAINAIEIAVVLDTTGSMGDELGWLKSELAAISTAVAVQFPGVTQRYALITYKDHGDAYVTKTRNFTTISAFQSQLSGEFASGGGDWPEAVPEALAELNTLAWSTGATARMVFHLADAPHHDADQAKVVAALNQLRTLGVHVYPIASSGVNDLTELTMRTEAQVTGGRYLFLTDDSGVGGAHQEPTLPCYHVTKLDKAMLRMIQMELTGLKIDPNPADVVRSGGDPQDGRCTLGSGESVIAL